jgi:hypothetical protein
MSQLPRQFHTVANIFPPMREDEFDALKADIAANGVREPIWTLGGQIIDGRHRARACDEIPIECPSREYFGADPLGFVVSLNLKRRHLTAPQLAMLTLEIEKVEDALDKERQHCGANRRHHDQ